MVNLTSDGNISISDDHIGLDVDYYDTVETNNENRTNITNITIDYCQVRPRLDLIKDHFLN